MDLAEEIRDEEIPGAIEGCIEGVSKQGVGARSVRASNGMSLNRLGLAASEMLVSSKV